MAMACRSRHRAAAGCSCSQELLEEMERLEARCSASIPRGGSRSTLFSPHCDPLTQTHVSDG